MNMQKTLLAASVAVVLATGANSASAVDVYLAGSSAQDSTIELLIVNNLAQGGAAAVTKYIDTTYGGNNFLAWTFPASAAVSGVTAGTIVTIHKRSQDGSGMGVYPVAKQVPTGQLDLTRTQTLTGKTSNGITAIYSVDSTVLNETNPVQLGISDVNPELFKGDNSVTSSVTAEGLTAPQAISAAAIAANATVTDAAGIVFGVAVNNALYNALQDAQGLSGTAGANHAVTATVGSTSGVHLGYGTGDAAGATDTMPSLSKSQVASLLATGEVGDWFNTSIASAVGASSAGLQFVGICRRDNGSGTQASSNTFFLDDPSSSAHLSPTVTFDNLFSGPEAILNTTTGNIEKCFNDFQFGTLTAPADAQGNQVPGAGYAIGVISTDKNTSGAQGYRFVKIDGVAPTAANVAAGKYEFYEEQAYLVPKAGKVGDTTGTPAGAIINYLINTATKASTLISLQASPQIFGQAYLLALSTKSANVPGAVTTSGSKTVTVIPFSHVKSGNLDDSRPSVLNVAPAAGTNAVLPLN